MAEAIDKEPVDLIPKLSTERHAQVFLRAGDQKRQLSLVKSFDTVGKFGDYLGIYRGCLTSYDKLIFSPNSETENKLYVCSSNGSGSKHIRMNFSPNKITLYDNNRALVSSAQDFIQILNLPDLTLGRKIKVGKECEAISSRDGKIWIKSEYKTLTVIDIDGNVLKEIKTTFNPRDICVHPSGDVYCTDYLNDQVYVVTLDGQDRQIFRNEKLKSPNGIAIDESGYLCVAGESSNNIHRISPNGQNHSIVLTEEDGISEPRGLDYSSETKELMVINKAGQQVKIYKVQ